MVVVVVDITIGDVRVFYRDRSTATTTVFDLLVVVADFGSTAMKSENRAVERYVREKVWRRQGQTSKERRKKVVGGKL